MLRILLFVLCLLRWIPSSSQSATVTDLCSNETDSMIECQSYQCPGGRYDCNYDRVSRKYWCDSRCPDGASHNRDPCTCLATYKGCHIRQNATDAVAHPTYKRNSQTTYSCVNHTDRNCHFDVHVLSAHRGNGDTISWANVLSAGRIDVDMSVNGEGNKSLVLVLLSHYPMNWMLNIPNGVVIAKVLLSSYHVDVSDVLYPTGAVESVERVSNILLPSLANGFDEHGDHTLQALKYLMERFGSVASFTGTYEADRWTLTIDRSPQVSDCSSVVPELSALQSSSPVISAQCHPLFFSSGGTCFINSFRASCSADGYCRCPSMEYRDECTCLVKFGSCIVHKSGHGDNSLGIPSYMGRTQITTSCVATDNCHNSVHVISVYEARSTGFAVRAGSASVSMSVRGEDTRPLILVLASYFPIRWSLSIPSGVVIDKVIVSSYYRYLSQTTVRYSTGRVRSLEKINCSRTVQCYADGYDDDTVQQLQYLSNRFGPVSSWSSAYRADSWRLNIRRSGCLSDLESPTSDSHNHSQICPVIPWISDSTNSLTTQSFPTFSPTFSLPFSSSSERPSLNSESPSSNTRANSAVLIPIATILTVIPIVTIAAVVLLMAIVIISYCIHMYRRQKLNSSSTHNQTVYNQVNQPPSLRGTQAFISTQQNSDFIPRTSTDIQEWSQIEGTPQGVLTDSAPPTYYAAVTYPPPVDEYKRVNVLNSNPDNPPPYPG